jgi:hypothetical protein
MKTMIATVVAAMFALNVAAYNTGVGPGNYCVKSIHGKMVVEKDGSAITKEVKFKDGTCIEPNGTVIMTSGKKIALKEGECVNETSVLNLDKHRNENWHKKDLNGKGTDRMKDNGTNDRSGKDFKKDNGTNDRSNKDHKTTKPEKKGTDKDYEYDYPKK